MLSPDPAPSPTVAPSAAEVRAERRAQKVERWAAADREMSAATAEVEGRSYGSSLSNILLGPIARQSQHVDNGGDPAAYDDQIVLGRTMVTNVLIERGDSPQAAAAKVARLETAHRTYASTPEAY